MKGLLIFTGFACFLGSLLLLWVAGSLFADFRTENITGPGVDVYLLNKYPLEGENILLEVSARGGSKTGLNNVMAFTVNEDQRMVAETQGEGVTWGETISNNGRGSDKVVITVPQQEVLHHGLAVFQLETSYVCAMGGAGTFNNEEKQDVVPVSLKIYSPGEKLRAQLLDLLIAFSFFAIWMLLWYVILKKIESMEGKLNHLEKDLTYPLMGLFFGGCMIGYWIFARYLAAIFSITATWFIIFVMIVWIAAPYFSYKMAKAKLKNQIIN